MEETYQYQDDWTDADRQQPFTYGGYGGYPIRGQDRALDRDRRFIRIHSSIRSFLFIHTTLTTRTLGNG